jgi:hypothetical protein
MIYAYLLFDYTIDMKIILMEIEPVSETKSWTRNDKYVTGINFRALRKMLQAVYYCVVIYLFYVSRN